MAPPMKSAANSIDSYSGGADLSGTNPPSNNLWIGNVSRDVSESELKSLFEKHGVVLSVITYPSRNYGFVNFKDVEGAKSAKQGLQGQMLRGNPLKIEFAKPAKQCKSLWVAGISPSTSKEELEKEFLRFGKVLEYRFLRDRNTAYIDYARLEDAVQALKSMNGKQIGGVPLRVDYLRSQPTRRDHGLDGREGLLHLPNRNMGLSDFHWIGHSNFNNYPEPGFSGMKRKNQLSTGSDGAPSKILFISHPPSVIIDEDMLHNAMILFGEIERIRTFSERNYAFVEFRSADEAKCAKEGLQGKLFNDPRISIEFSSIEFPGYREHPHPMHPLGLGVYGPEVYARPPMGAPGLLEPPFHGLDFFDLANIHNLHNPNPPILMGGGPSWRKSSPPGIVSPSAGFVPNGAWDVFDGNHAQREHKRLRLESGSPPDNMGGFDEKYGLHSSGPITRGTTSRHGPRHVDSDCIWRGLIAKVGTPVCRARCVPIGEGLDMDIPDVVNCTARTGLDVLTERYDDAIGFSAVFFVPDSEDDFASYTEFLRYLGSKDRAGVAKFDDGTTLFLVPPSDFLTNVLKVSGPERLYGVVLKFPTVVPNNNSSDMNPLSRRFPHYMDPHKINRNGVDPVDERVSSFDNAKFSYNEVKFPPKAVAPVPSTLPVRSTPQPGVGSRDERVSSFDNSRFSHNDVKFPPKSVVPVTSSLPVWSTSQPVVDYGDERVSSFDKSMFSQNNPNFPPKVSAPVSSSLPVPVPVPSPSKPALALTPELIASLTKLLPASSSGLSQPVSSTTGPDTDEGRWKHEHQGLDHSDQFVQMSSQMNPQMGSNTPGNIHQPLNSYGAMHDFRTLTPQGASSSETMANVIPMPAGHYRQGSVGSSNPVHATGVSMHQPYTPLPAEFSHQSEPLQIAPGGAAQENVETESDKNERYKSTLLFAANLLSRIHQPGNHSEQGAGSH